MDLETGMYVAYGYSNVSEKAAFRKAIRFVEGRGFPFESIASGQVLQLPEGPQRAR